MMAERCIDANVAIKWFIKGEAFRRTALRLLRESLLAGIILIAPPLFESETDGIIQTRLVEGRTTPEVADRTFGYCWRTQKYRNLCIPHAFFEGKKAWDTCARKSTSRTLK